MAEGEGETGASVRTMPASSPATRSRRHRAEPRWPASARGGNRHRSAGPASDRLVLGPIWVLPTLEGALDSRSSSPTPSATARRRQCPPRSDRADRADQPGQLALARQPRDPLFRDPSRRWSNAHLFGPPGLVDQHHRVRALVLGARSGRPGGGAGKTEASVTRLSFPTDGEPGLGQPEWSPSFFDYLYTSFTNVTTFSPTDTVALTPVAKF